MSLGLPPEPLIPVYAIEDALSFRCPFCRRLHWHGRAGAAIGDITYRGAHCIRKTSPLFAKGVSLVIVAEVKGSRGVPRWSAEAIVNLNKKAGARDD